MISVGEKLMNYRNNQAVNVKQKLFLKCFNKINEMGNAKQLPINVINDDHCIVGMYYPIKAYDKLDNEIDELKKEIKRLENYHYNDESRGYLV